MFNHPEFPRYGYLLLWLGCSLLIAIALYMQYQMGLIPCALCMTQRVFVIATGVIALIAWLHNPGSKTIQRFYPIAGIVLAVIGASFSSRHIWLQGLPEDLVPACGPGLSYLISNVPFLEALTVLLQGDGHCADIDWSFLGLSIPAWTLVMFIGMIITNALIAWRAFIASDQE